MNELMEKMNVKLNGVWTKYEFDIYSGERKEEDRVGERMILIGLAEKGNLDIDHVFEEYEINEEYARIRKSMSEYVLPH